MLLKTRILLMLVFFVWLPSTQAWLAPVDFTADNEGTGGDMHTVTAVGSGDNYDRCDTAETIYTDPGGHAPSSCHRWNLVWEPVTSPDDDWKPEQGGAGYRLPTIKELVRLFDYTGETGLASNPIINSWLTTTADKKEWLISSSYRDIDGVYSSAGEGNGRLQIFAINITTGEVRTFEPGLKTVSTVLRLCESLDSDGSGDCSLDGSHTIQAIKVKTDWLSEL